MDLDKEFRNKLIVFEGMDKTGKTSVAKALVNYLNANGVNAIFTFQPGDTSYGTLAPLFRSLCKDMRWGIHELTNFFIFFADKTEQVDKVIRPYLEKGYTVISDRWWYSTFAYQFYGKRIVYKYGLEYRPEIVEWINKVSVLNYEPDITYYFPFQLNVERKQDKNDMFENTDRSFMKRVRDAYEYLARKHKFVRVEPGNSVEETVEKIIRGE
jgi:dTMP kinase